MHDDELNRSTVVDFHIIIFFFFVFFLCGRTGSLTLTTKLWKLVQHLVCDYSTTRSCYWLADHPNGNVEYIQIRFGWKKQEYPTLLLENGISQNVDEKTLFNGIDLGWNDTPWRFDFSVKETFFFFFKLLDLLMWIKEKKTGYHQMCWARLVLGN